MKKRKNAGRSISIMLVLALLLGMVPFLPAAASPGDNLIANGNFASDLSGWTVRWSGTNQEFVHDATFGHDANGSAKAVPCGQSNNGLYLVDVEVEPGAEYEITYYGYSATHSPAYMDVGEGGGEGNLAKGGLTEYNNSWEKVTFSFTPTEEKVLLRFVVSGLTEGNVWFDDVTLVKKSAGGLNGTFDESISGWNGSGFTWDSGFYKTDAGSICVDESIPMTTRVVSVTVPVVAGAEYTISYWGYKDTAASTYLDVHDGDVDNNQIIQLGTNASGKWLKNGATITPTQNKVRIRIVVDNYTGGNFWVDDIVFEKKPESLSENLLENGDFEGSDFSHWWFREDWNGGYWEVKDGVGVDGSRGLQAVSTVDNPDGSYNIGLYYTLITGTNGPLTLTAGETYELSFMVYRGAGVDSHTYMDDESGHGTSLPATKNGRWETVTGRFVATSELYNIRLVCNALNRGEVVYVDNISLKMVTPEPTVDDVPDRSLCVNGSFENGRGATAFGWGQNVAWNRVGAENGIEPVDGDCMMKVEAEATNLCIGTPITVKPNTYYIYTAKMYRTDGRGSAYLNLLDENQADIPGTQMGTETTGQWVTVSYTFFSGNHTRVYPRMVIDGTTDADPSGAPVYFDDICFTEQVWENSKAFPQGTELTDIRGEYSLSTGTTSAGFAVTGSGIYMTSLTAADSPATEYVTEAIKAPLASVINDEPVTWVYQSASVENIENGQTLTAVFHSADGKYAIQAVFTARNGRGPIEYHQYLTGLTEDLSLSYPEAVSANFRIEPDGDTTLYRFSRSRVNDGSDPLFSQGTLTTALSNDMTVLSSVENGYSPVSSILPYQVLDVNGTHGVYFGHYWSFGKLLVRTNNEGDIAITTYLSDDSNATIDRAQGETLEIPGFFIGAYTGDVDDGSNDMKSWFWDYKITRSLHDNECEPYVEQGDYGITVTGMESLFNEWWPDIANYVNILKIDYIWTLPDNTNPRVDKTTEDLWLPDPTRYPDGMNVWEYMQAYAAQDGIDAPIMLSLYMADTYQGVDIGTQEGREAQLQALKDRMNPEDNAYGIGYDVWRSDFVVENSYDYDSHEGLLYILDEMIQYSSRFRYEHCSGAGSLKDFTTLERMSFMTTEDSAHPLNHRMSLYANTYMISPTQLKADINMIHSSKDYGGLTGLGPICTDENGNEIPVWTDPEYVKYALRTGMLGANMLCFNTEGLLLNKDTIEEHYDLYNDVQRPILRDCDVYHIMAAPTGWDWNDWDGIEYYNTNIDKGVVQLFKENASAPDEKTIVLKGLDSLTEYSLTFIDRTGQNCVMTGEELMTTGIHVTGMTEQYDSEIIYIEPYTENQDPGEQGITGVSFPDGSFRYDGTAKYLAVEGLLDTDQVVYDNNGQTEAGEYTVTATVTRDGCAPLILTARLTITKDGETGNTDGGGTAGQEPSNTKTGDSSSLWIWVACAAAAMTACVVLIGIWRNKRKKRDIM